MATPIYASLTSIALTLHFTQPAIFVRMSSFCEKSDKKHDHISTDSRLVDTGAELGASLHAHDPVESLEN